MLTLILAVTLLGLWLVLSGHYTILLVTLGVVSCGLVTWVAARMEITDSEGVPIHLVPGVVGYWGWLIKEMFLANVAVARIVLSRRPPIQPSMMEFRTRERSDMGKVIFGNSITLTPGTVTTDIDGDTFRVHALASRFRVGLEGGEMDDRVLALEGRNG